MQKEATGTVVFMYIVEPGYYDPLYYNPLNITYFTLQWYPVYTHKVIKEFTKQHLLIKKQTTANLLTILNWMGLV